MENHEKKTAAIWIEITKLISPEDNPRINDHVVDRVAKSIESYGFASPIVANYQNEILAGNTRYKAAKKLGLKTVPVRQINLTGDKARLYRIADNKLSELAEWNEDLLRDQLFELHDDYTLELSNMGFSDDELTDLLNQSSLSDQPDPQEITDHDDFDNTKPTTTRFKTGHVEVVGKQKIICGDCIEVLKSMPDGSVDSIVTDPPYQISFMSKKWDKEFDTEEWARQCLRVLKPGGHIIAFAATRTIHKIMYSLENQGFEIRDLISWLYFSGFPKSHNVSKAIDKHFGVEREVVGERPQRANKSGVAAMNASISDVEHITKPATKEAIKYDGWGTALKPAQEPAVLCRKPLEKGLSIAQNMMKHNTGGLNIDACRFAYGDPCWVGQSEDPGDVVFYNSSSFQPNSKPGTHSKGVNVTHNPNKLGRWPANIYQCPKASRGEREEGLEDHESKTGHEAVNRKEGSAGLNNPRAGAGRTASEVKNFHPTVKPVKLMSWLVKLITPIDGVVVDTFCGSGTTLVASELEKYNGIGIEMNPEYCEIIYGRVEHATKK